MGKQFEVGKSYATRSIGDHDCIFRFKILARTAKTVTVEVHGKTVKRGLTVYENVEQFKPFGTYSMCAIIGADDRAERLASEPVPSPVAPTTVVPVVLTLDDVSRDNCRIYYRSATRALYCIQDDTCFGRPAFKFYRCSQDGEPSHEVTNHPFSDLSIEYAFRMGQAA